MNTPDSRPIGVLTPAILATASHWCIHRKGIADIRPYSTLVLRPPEFDDDLPILTCEGECYWNDDSNWMCYPCTLQPDGMVVPEPWPVLDGEEEILQWRGLSSSLQAIKYRHYKQSWAWVLNNGSRSEQVRLRAQPIAGYHPAPRKGGKWVWEADR